MLLRLFIPEAENPLYLAHRYGGNRPIILGVSRRRLVRLVLWAIALITAGRIASLLLVPIPPGNRRVEYYWYLFNWFAFVVPIALIAWHWAHLRGSGLLGEILSTPVTGVEIASSVLWNSMRDWLVIYLACAACVAIPLVATAIIAGPDRYLLYSMTHLALSVLFQPLESFWRGAVTLILVVRMRSVWIAAVCSFLIVMLFTVVRGIFHYLAFFITDPYDPYSYLLGSAVVGLLFFILKAWMVTVLLNRLAPRIPEFQRNLLDTA